VGFELKVLAVGSAASTGATPRLRSRARPLATWRPRLSSSWASRSQTGKRRWTSGWRTTSPCRTVCRWQHYGQVGPQDVAHANAPHINATYPAPGGAVTGPMNPRCQEGLRGDPAAWGHSLCYYHPAAHCGGTHPDRGGVVAQALVWMGGRGNKASGVTTSALLSPQRHRRDRR
jgi:hypothetical protein